MIATAVCLALAATPGQDPAPAEPTRDERVAAWRDALELDLPGEVVAEGPRLVGAGGPLARDGEALALVARALFDAGREPLARSLVTGARIEDEVGRAHVDLARAAFALADDDLEAVVDLLAPKGVEGVRHAAFAESWLYVGRAYARAGNGARAAPYLTRFLELAPFHGDAPSALHMLAQNALRRRDLEAARSHRDRAAELTRWLATLRARRFQAREDPTAPEPVLGIAQVWLAAKQLDRARSVLDGLVVRFPAFARGWSHLGEARRLGGDAPGARAAYDRALELDAGELLARYNRGALARLEDRVDDARADFEWLVAEGPNDDVRTVGACLALARIELDAGAAKRAEELYARYRALGGTEPLR